ncbi:MAG: AAA family ATPase [Anaerolineales bacterium]
MITSLQFQNWRSLRAVRIENLGPLTVFIGANASGKSNIFDALHFLREGVIEDEGALSETAFRWGRYDNLRTRDADEPIIMTLTGRAEHGLHGPLHARLAPDNGANPLAPKPYWGEFLRRWQLLAEGFNPATAITRQQIMPLQRMELDGRNLPVILDYLRSYKPHTYRALLADLRALHDHIDSVETYANDYETRIIVNEKHLPDAPTVSAGTGRTLAILAAMHLLDVRDERLPGLLFVEEPNTAIHPQLHQRLVERLRAHVTNPEGGPRQIFLTTHNPSFLNLFAPDEVRIVARGADGHTTVQPVPDDLAAAWQADGVYGLGAAWYTVIEKKR